MLTQDVTRTLRASKGVHNYVWTMVQGIARTQIEEAQALEKQAMRDGGTCSWNSMRYASPKRPLPTSPFTPLSALSPLHSARHTSQA